MALFEQVFPYLPISTSEMELLNVVDRWKLDLSGNLISYYENSVFDVHGIDYDLLKRRKCKVHIISSAFGMYSDQRTSQVLAEYYPNTSLYLVNTTHQLKESGLLGPFLLALFSEKMTEKMTIYEKLLEAQVIYRHKSNPGLEGLP